LEAKSLAQPTFPGYEYRFLEAEVDACRAKWDAVNQERFQGGICPTCGQPLPQDKLEASKTAFERDKARRKKEAVDAADRAKAALAGFLEDIAGLEREAAEDAEKTARLNQRLVAQKDAKNVEIRDMNGYAAKKAELETQAAELWGQMDGLDKQSEEGRKALRDALAEADRELDRLSGELAKKTALEYASKRMEELRAQAAAASNELNQVDGMLFLCDEFTRFKVKFIEESVNRRFSLVRFRLFKEQINGGLEECCDVLVKGAAVGDNLNTGAEFQAGVDIINTLSRCYGIYVPLFIDGCESVTGPLGADTQTIRLVVSEMDKELRCELK